MVNTSIKRIIVAAVSENGIIGNKNEIPWYSKDELNHFKNLTSGFPIIVGRNTFTSIGKQLPNRLNIVITSNPSLFSNSTNLLFFKSLFDAYKYLREYNYKNVFICGGEKIYRSAIKYCEEMIISHMKICVEGDARFPKINFKKWEIINKSELNEFVVIHYKRK